MESKLCSICGEENDEYLHTLKCGHTFHYQCLYLTFVNSRTTNCPYCRGNNNFLPLINGLRKVTPWIHNCYYSDYKSQECKHILTRGKNKGKKCSKNCKLGYDLCTQHFNMDKKNNIKENKTI